MDLSKLPKLSDSRSQDQSSSAPLPAEPMERSDPRQPLDYRQSLNDPDLGADIWVNVIIGLLLIAMGFTFAKFLFAKLTGQAFHTGVNWTGGPNAGNEVDYFDLEGFTAWTQMGMFLFGVVLLLEAASKAAVVLRPGAASRGILKFALALTLITTALNLYVCIRMLGVGMIPLLSGLAVAFGGWILASEWRMLKLRSLT
jgi:hypothetical protein